MPEMEERRNGFATIRTIEKIETKRDGPYITITFTLNGALYKMVGVITYLLGFSNWKSMATKL